MAIGPSTFDWKFSDLPDVSSHTACRFTGSPATAASCEATLEAAGQTETVENEYHFTVPGDTSVWASYNIVSATLKVVDGTVEASTTANTTASMASETASSTGTNLASPTAAGSESGSAASNSGNTARSTAFARETGAPAAKWIVGVGAAVGAVVAA